MPQRQLRDVVVRLSRCVSRLSPAGRRLLLLRAGIGVGPLSPRAIARTLHVSVARQRRREHAALRTLLRAARTGRCGSTPDWVHVPPGNRLVLVDPVLTTPAVSSTKVSSTPGAARSPLLYAWWRLVWMAPQQS